MKIHKLITMLQELNQEADIHIDLDNKDILEVIDIIINPCPFDEDLICLDITT